VCVREGKGDSEREVPLNATARRAIQAYLGFRDNPKRDQPLFLSQRGRPLSVRGTQHLLQ